MKNNKVNIIAGPCSVDEDNIQQIYDIAKIEIDGKKAINGTRVVGLKSRTSFDQSGKGMGMDFDVFMKNMQKLIDEGSTQNFEIPPSVKIAEQIVNDTDLIIATEIMSPLVQLPAFSRDIFRGKLMPWNPSVTQLGWHLLQMSEFAKKNDWFVGIKNGKWIGKNLSDLDDNTETPIEKVWMGLSKYSDNIGDKVVLIHRGFDVPEKGEYRNLPVHMIPKRIKQQTKNIKIYFDPSHSYGPAKRDQIVEGTIEALKMTINEEEYLYDGILIEVGDSKTDTDQHITINELKDLIKEIFKFRN